jgi:hypothetical protein
MACDPAGLTIPAASPSTKMAVEVTVNAVQTAVKELLVAGYEIQETTIRDERFRLN